MSEARTGGRAPDAIRRKADDAMGAAEWLGLMAAPAFGIMALVTAVHSDPANLLCSAAYEGFPLSGMTLMYALMSIFHAAPWLKLISRRRE